MKVTDRTVVAASEAWAGFIGGRHTPHEMGEIQEEVRVILEAAAPSIAARALEEAADAFDDLRMDRDAVRIVPGTWEYFELFPIQHIRDRAESLRTMEGEEAK